MLVLLKTLKKIKSLFSVVNRVNDAGSAIMIFCVVFFFYLPVLSKRWDIRQKDK